MEKVIRDGMVAVLYSPGFGAGWFSWNTCDELLFHPKLVEIVEKRRQNEITEEWIEENLGIEGVYCGGASDLCIKWVPQNTPFRIDEYDGSESVVLFNENDFIIA
jgi:hypothetical protein